MRALILKSCRQQIFIKKLKNLIFHFFFEIIQYPFNGIFHISFCVCVPLNNTQNNFLNKKTKKTRFLYFCHKMVTYAFNALCQLNPWELILKSCRKQIFIKKLKNKMFHFFPKSYNIPLMEFFTLAFACAYP